MRREVRNILLSILLLLPLQLLSISGGTKEILDSARIAYEKEDHRKALSYYQKVAQDHRSPSLYYNMGNAALKAEKLGKAVLYYQKGRKLDPWDPDLKHNLSIAQERTRDEFHNDPPRTLWGGFKDFIVAAPIGEWWSWSLLFSCLSGATLLIAGLLPKGKRDTALVSVILFLFLTLLFYGSYKGKQEILGSKDRAVILSPSVQVRSEPRTSASTAFVLHEGTTVDVRGRKKEWTEIRTPDEQVGWIRKKELTRF